MSSEHANRLPISSVQFGSFLSRKCERALKLAAIMMYKCLWSHTLSACIDVCRLLITDDDVRNGIADVAVVADGHLSPAILTAANRSVQIALKWTTTSLALTLQRGDDSVAGRLYCAML